MKLEHFKYIMEVHLFLTWVYLQQNRIFCVFCESMDVNLKLLLQPTNFMIHKGKKCRTGPEYIQEELMWW